MIRPIPTQEFLCVRMEVIKREGNLIVLPDAVKENNDIELHYGVVEGRGPHCKIVKMPGTKVLFLPSNIIAGFNQGEDELFIIPESAVFATID